MRVKCSNCESVFHEDYLCLNGIAGEAFCPICDMPIDINEDIETDNYTQFKRILEDGISVTDLVCFDEYDDETLDILVHNIVNGLRTDKKCPRCNADLYLSDLPEYDYVCVECEENFYECEVK